MKEFDEAALESVRGLENSLPTQMFKKFLLTTLTQYIMTPLFIQNYSHMLTTDEICSRPMSAGCVRQLITDGLFDYEKWLENIQNNDLSILLDDEFISKFNPDIEKIFEEVKNISKDVYDKYISNASDIVKRNLITKCKNAEESDIINNIGCLGPNDFHKYTIDNILKREDILEKIFDEHSIKNIVTFISLINRYPCLKYRDKFDDFDFDMLSDEDYVRFDKFYVPILSSIITSYPVDAVCSIMNQIHYSNPKIFQAAGMHNVLRYFLTSCDNIEERVLINMINAFAINSLTTELKNYGKNYGYKDLLLAIAL